MNTPNPLVPQGSLPSRGKSTVRIAFFTILGLHVVFIGGLLFVGCSKDTPPPVSGTEEFTNSQPYAVEQTNNPAVGGFDTNTPPVSDPYATSGVVAMPSNSASVVTTPSPLPPPIPVATMPTGTEYTVAAGDILGTIARKNGVSLKALLEANPGVDPKKLKIGQKLQIPAASAPVASAPSFSSESGAAESSTYVVKSGDMLEKIARTHGTTVKAIVALNGLKSANSIKPGQKLKLPAPKSAAAPVSAAPAAPLSSLPIAAPTAVPAVPATPAN